MKQTDYRTNPSRSKPRVNQNLPQIFDILDEAYACTISFTKDGEPRALPTGHVRCGNKLYVHGSVKSHFFRQIAEAKMVCVTAFVLDGIVLAKSALHHSFNYRSVVLFAKPLIVKKREEKDSILAEFTDRYVPGRWEQIRRPTPQELDATEVIGFEIEEASAKMRQGPPNDSEKDRKLPVWSGVVPVGMQVMEPVPDEYTTVTELPEHLQNIYKK